MPKWKLLAVVKIHGHPRARAFLYVADPRSTWHFIYFLSARFSWRSLNFMAYCSHPHTVLFLFFFLLLLPVYMKWIRLSCPHILHKTKSFTDAWNPNHVQVPYFCLPADKLTDVIAPSCYRWYFTWEFVVYGVHHFTSISQLTVILSIDIMWRSIWWCSWSIFISILPEIVFIFNT